MGEVIFIATVLVFVRLMSPIVAVLSIILFLSPSLFKDIEKRLSYELDAKKRKETAVNVLEKENS